MRDPSGLQVIEALAPQVSRYQTEVRGYNAGSLWEQEKRQRYVSPEEERMQMEFLTPKERFICDLRAAIDEVFYSHIPVAVKAHGR